MKKAHRAPDYLHINGSTDPEHSCQQGPIMIEGVTYLPAGEFSFISLEDETTNRFTHGMLLLRIQGGPMGLNIAMTPDTLRSTAYRMLDVADRIERGAAQVTKDAFAAAGKPRT